MEDFLKEIESILKLPDFDDVKNAVIVQPHPDDADIAIGASIAKLVDSGVEVTYITVTDGSMGTKDRGMTRRGLRDVRRKEQERAAEVLGVHELVWLDFPDGGDYSEIDVRNEIINVLRKLKPDLVLTVDPFVPYEAHPDHRKCGMATSEAVLFCGFPLLDGVEPLDEDIRIEGIAYFFTASPNYFYCVDGYMEKKFQAISKHVSQFDEETLKILRWYFEKKSKMFGKRVGCEFAEPFKILNTAMLHAFPEAQEV